jgi:hypothetical protein
MEVLTSKAVRASTRRRVEIPLTVTSLDRAHPFAEKCLVLVISCHGCGFRSSHALQIGTPIMLSGLPGGGSVTARVASCLPLGKDDKSFLIGAALYIHGNVWQIENPPEDWKSAPQIPAATAPLTHPVTPDPSAANKSWPYSIFGAHTEAPLCKK